MGSVAVGSTMMMVEVVGSRKVRMEVGRNMSSPWVRRSIRRRSTLSWLRMYFRA